MRGNDIFNIEGKLIIITGASSGIGQQCAITCSKMGARLVLLGRSQERLKETFDMLENQSEHISFLLDLVKYDKTADVISEIVKLKGKISGLINCAGISTTLAFNAISTQKMEHFFQTNVMGAMNLTKHVLKNTHFSEQGGSIVFISSVMGLVGEKGKSLYSLTKGSLIATSRSMAIELAPRKIRVNCISPGVVKTPMSQKAVYSNSEESLKEMISLHPLGLGKPEDIAYASVYLLSDASNWITGTNLIVDGGYTAK